MKFRLFFELFFFNIFIILSPITGCVNFLKPCNLENSFACFAAQTRWQEAIDTVVAINFPNDYGKYQALVWDNLFDNAWVTKGREIHITRQLVSKLDRSYLICVAAHELAHLKMGHYYAKIGIIIIKSKRPEQLNDYIGHYGALKKWPVPKGFGKNQEKEADSLALKFIQRLGLSPRIYLGLLKLFLKNDTHSISPSSMKDRIRFLRSQESFPPSAK